MTAPVKRKPVCTLCGSGRILRDAWAEWDEEKQDWVLGQEFDEYFCENCEADCGIEWYELDEEAEEMKTSSVHYTMLGLQMQPKEADANGFLDYRENYDIYPDHMLTGAEKVVRDQVKRIEAWRDREELDLAEVR